MFGIVPTWTDLVGAGMILVTVMATTMEKSIASLCGGEEVRKGEAEVTGEDHTAAEGVKTKDLASPA